MRGAEGPGEEDRKEIRAFPQPDTREVDVRVQPDAAQSVAVLKTPARGVRRVWRHSENHNKACLEHKT